MTDANSEPLDPAEKRLSSIEQEVGKLRVLAEANEHTIKLIVEGHGAKLDSHSRKLDAHSRKLDSHSRKLDKIIKALAPLQQIRDFMVRVAGEHEQRIGDLEKRVGIRE